MFGIVLFAVKSNKAILDGSTATEKHPRMRDKVGCRDEFHHNFQNLSESLSSLNTIINTMGKHQTPSTKLYKDYFNQS